MKEYEKPSICLFLLEENFNVFLKESTGIEKDNDGLDEDWFD